MNDAELITALKAGEPWALDRFYRDHAKQVLAWSIRLGGPGLDAEDTAQEVFAIALKRIGSFRGESRVSTWLFAITRNVINNARRRAAFKRLIGIGADVDTVRSNQIPTDEELDRLRRRRLVQSTLERLKASQREVLVLMDMDERTAPEVGEMLGLPVGTVYSRLHYARQAFAKALQREGIRAHGSVAIPESSQ